MKQKHHVAMAQGSLKHLGLGKRKHQAKLYPQPRMLTSNVVELQESLKVIEIRKQPRRMAVGPKSLKDFQIKLTIGSSCRVYLIFPQSYLPPLPAS